MIDAADVARNAGLVLKAKGSRLWTCCPLHGEKTPSMCFFPDGRYHCFGCGADGDAADLYAALHGVSLAEALRICKGEHKPDSPRRKVENIRQKVERWFSEQWSLACKEKHEAQFLLAGMAMENPEYWNSVQRLAIAQDRLNHLESVNDSPVGKTILYMEAMSDKQRTRTNGMGSRRPA